MRYFQCFDCGHYWIIVFWVNSKDTKKACPECKSLNVHQIEKVRGWDQEGKYTSVVNNGEQTPICPGYETFKRLLNEKEP